MFACVGGVFHCLLACVGVCWLCWDVLQVGEDQQDASSLSVIFRKKSPMISSSFAENDLQLKASYGSSPLCRVRCCAITEDMIHKYVKDPEQNKDLETRH